MADEYITILFTPVVQFYSVCFYFNNMASQKFNSETAIGMLFMSSSDDSDSEVNYSSDDCVSIIYIKFNLLEIMHIYIVTIMSK